MDMGTIVAVSDNRIDGDVPSTRSGTGEAKATATRDRRAMNESCIFAIE